MVAGGGCADGNLACNTSQIVRDNYINTLRPLLTWPSFKPGATGTGTYLGGLPKLWRPLWLPNFGPWAPGSSAGVVPPGNIWNVVPTDRAGLPRDNATTDAPGCYVAPLRGGGPVVSPSPPQSPPQSPPHSPPQPPPQPPAEEFWLPDGQPYPMALPADMRHIWVDPVAGSNANSGATRGQALRTLAAAYLAIPPVGGRASRACRRWAATVHVLSTLRVNLHAPACCGNKLASQHARSQPHLMA